ncbi:MAG: OB-fold domain-containing protein [Acidimicrobiia bacterium]|jgi:hypothetical protein|nr:OB-fold domain-containing protein [Acidimicrobiia bacterium]
MSTSLPDETIDPNAPVANMDYFMALEFKEAICPVVQRYTDGLLAGKIIGHRCSQCGLVYVPPRGYCPIDVLETTEEDEVELADRGIVTNYTVVTPVQYYGQEATEPFAKVSVLLDEPGGMLSLQDVLEVPVEQVRIGMRLEAVWVPESDRTVEEIGNRSWGSADGCILGWRATGEPDVSPDQFNDRVF